jgi:hypothetical protein
MFDLRYHIASLAAVFVALAVGIVIGVAIAGDGNLEETTQDLRRSELAALEQRLDEAQERGDRLEQSQQSLQRFADAAYEPIVADRLTGARIAMIFLGEDEAGLRDDIDATLDAAGQPFAANVTALDLPIDLAAIGQLLRSDPELAVFAGEENLGTLGEALGRELVTGGEMPLWTSLEPALAAESLGGVSEPLDGVVVVRSWHPAEEASPVDAERDDQTEALIAGIVSGMADSLGVTVVGVAGREPLEGPSSIDFFKRVDVSTVADVGSVAGRVALVLLLAGGDPGHYGVDEEQLTPPIELSSESLPVAGG